jgi:hypothetical protein
LSLSSSSTLGPNNQHEAVRELTGGRPPWLAVGPPSLCVVAMTSTGGGGGGWDVVFVEPSGQRRKGGRGLRGDNDDDKDNGGVGKGAGARGAPRLRRTMTGWMQLARSECVIFSSGKTEVIGQGTAPVLVPMTSVFFGLFSHTFKIKPTLDNTLVDITPSFVLS